MKAVRDLCLGILGRHQILPHLVVGHSDIAPDRKQDPGELFDWAWLAGQGIGLWTEETPAPADLQADLAAIGYDMGLPLTDVVTAFQRHFLPDGKSGGADAATCSRAAAVRRLVDRAAG